MARILIGIIAGAFAAYACIFLIEYLDASLYPLPAGVDPNSAAGASNMAESMGLPARLLVMLGWCAGTLVGGAVAAHYAHRAVAAWIVAGFVVVRAFTTIADVPHPGPMVAAALVLPALCAFAVQRFARRRRGR